MDCVIEISSCTVIAVPGSYSMVFKALLAAANEA